MLKDLQHNIIRRQSNLISYLKNNTDILPLDIQHKIYGSIKELENIHNFLREVQAKVYKER
ncbi:MAG: hypothetical protein QXE31_01825 [Candidatus Woesearchaeota archaeon]